MPHRAYHLIVGVAGLFFVAALLLAGANLLRHSRLGAGWKQRLVSAGLLLLGALGFGSLGAGGAGCKQGAPPVDKPSASKPDGPDKPTAAKPDAMKQLQALQSEAEAIAQGKKGRYPFDSKGKDQLLTALNQGKDSIDDLRRAGRINTAEAGLWKAELALLASKVADFRSSEMKAASCYQERQLPLPRELSLTRLRQRLPLVQKLAAANKLNPAVTRQVLRRIELDLKQVGKPAGDVEQALLTNAQELLVKIKARLEPPQGAAAPGQEGAVKASAWDTIKAAWRLITPLAQDSSKSTKLQRRQASEKMKQALAAVTGLAAAGKLNAAEAELLKTQAARLQADMLRDPPRDFEGRCYRRVMVTPAHNSLHQINRRLPLLEKLVAAGKIDPKVLAQVIPVLERDLSVLTSPRAVKKIRNAEQRAKVPGAVKQAQALLTKLKAMAK